MPLALMLSAAEPPDGSVPGGSKAVIVPLAALTKL